MSQIGHSLLLALDRRGSFMDHFTAIGVPGFGLKLRSKVREADEIHGRLLT